MEVSRITVGHPANDEDSLAVRWRENRHRQQEVPASEAWRGSFGIGFLVRELPPEEHGRTLVPSEDVTPLMLRDVPVGRFAHAAKRPVEYGTIGSIRLEYGAPVLDLENPREGFDLSRAPYDYLVAGARKGISDEEIRKRVTKAARFLQKDAGSEASLGMLLRDLSAQQLRVSRASGDRLNTTDDGEVADLAVRVSERMTDAAYNGVLSDGDPLRRSWFDRRDSSVEAGQIPRPSRWMPQAFTGIGRLHVEDLFETLTREERSPESAECAACGIARPLAEFSSIEGEDSEEDLGCPVCGRPARVGAESIQEAKYRDRFDRAFRDGFVADARQALPLRFGMPVELREVRRRKRTIRCVFRAGPSDREISIELPKGLATLHAEEGQTLGQGEVFARGLGEAVTGPVPRAWAHLERAAGIRHLQEAWIHTQALDLAGDPRRVYFPSQLVAVGGRSLQPSRVLLDMSHMSLEELRDGAYGVACPPLPVGKWDREEVVLPGSLRLKARIKDPRFKPRRPKSGQARPAAPAREPAATV